MTRNPTPTAQKEHIISDSDFNQIYEIEYNLTCEERRSICERSRPLSAELRAERERVLNKLKSDLKTRFISSGNQWSKGRNSGLLECCNIIDEHLRGES